jgi:hypothetical protein
MEIPQRGDNNIKKKKTNKKKKKNKQTNKQTNKKTKQNKKQRNSSELISVKPGTNYPLVKLPHASSNEGPFFL